MPVPYKSPLERKLNYVHNLASEEGINLTSMVWAGEIDIILQNLSFNFLFNFLLDLYLHFNLYFNIPELDFEMPNFGDFFFDLETGLTFNQIEQIQKAQYGVSKYGMSIYDPEQVSSKPLKRLLWDLRYKTTDKDGATIKLSGESLKQWVSHLKEYLAEREVLDYYYDHMEEILALIEGKLSSVSYWDFACFDVSVFSDEYKFKSRFTDDWRSEKELETTGIYDVHFDYCRFDYSRFSDSYEHGTIGVKEELGDDLENRIDEYHRRVGFIEQYGQKVLHQRVFFYQKEDKMHWEGGKHQISLANLKNEIKRLLNKEGVIVQFRMAYLAFAQELYYLTYEPHRKYKQWKKILTVDELINKYRRMGCDVDLLNKIKGEVEKWR